MALFGITLVVNLFAFRLLAKDATSESQGQEAPSDGKSEQIAVDGSAQGGGETESWWSSLRQRGSRSLGIANRQRGRDDMAAERAARDERRARVAPCGLTPHKA